MNSTSYLSMWCVLDLKSYAVMKKALDAAGYEIYSANDDWVHFPTSKSYTRRWIGTRDGR